MDILIPFHGRISLDLIRRCILHNRRRILHSALDIPDWSNMDSFSNGQFLNRRKSLVVVSNCVLVVLDWGCEVFKFA